MIDPLLGGPKREAHILRIAKCHTTEQLSPLTSRWSGLRNALVVVYNVWLKRLEMRGQGSLAERVDKVLDWAYPLAYIVLFGFVIGWFF